MNDSIVEGAKGLRGLRIVRNCALSLLLLLNACGPIVGKGGPIDPTDIITQVIAEIDRSITNISTDGTQWVGQLQSLVTYLSTQGLTQAATYVRDTLQNGIARVGLEFRCNVDFTANRVKQGLQALRDEIARIRGDTSTARIFPPFVCSATPNSIAWVEAPQSVVFSGYDFRRDTLSAVVVGRAGQATDISAALNQPSPYEVTMNLSGAGAAFPRDCSHVELRFSGSSISSLSCLTDCPPPPPPTIIPADTRIIFDDTQTCGDSVLTGCRLDKDVSIACPNKYFRNSPFEVTRTAGKGPGNCGEGDPNNIGARFATVWLSSNTADCSIHEHIGLQGGTFQGFRTCHYVVSATKPQQVIPNPPPQVGWCR